MSPRSEAVSVFLAFFALGLYAMAPSVTFGDAGEFAAAAATLGLPHAPSYPLFVLLGKALGTALPWGNWAYRTNLLSNLCAAGALALLGDGLRRSGFGALARLSAVGLLGFCALWRYQAAVTEVFALHGLALGVLLWLVCRFAGRLWEDRPMAALGLAAGLGLGNHHTLVLVLPAVFLEAWMNSPRGNWKRGTALFALFGLIGFSIYLFLPLRAANNPPLDWGHPTDLGRFLHVLLRRDYGSFSLTVEGRAGDFAGLAWLQQTARYLEVTLHELGLPVLLTTAIGATAWKSKGCSIGPAFFPVWLLLAGPIFLCIGKPPLNAQTSSALERFFLASWLGLAPLFGAGVGWLFADGAKAARVAAVVLALWPAGAAWASRGAWVARGDFAAYDYGRAVLNGLPPKTEFVMDGGDDTFYTTAFLAYAQKMRTDVRLHDRGGVVFPGFYGPDFRRLTNDGKNDRRNLVEAPLAKEGRLVFSSLGENLVPGYRLVAAGLLRFPVPEHARGAPSPLWSFIPERREEALVARHYRDRALAAFYPVMKAADAAERGDFRTSLRHYRAAWELGRGVQWLGEHIDYALGLLGWRASQKGDWGAAEAIYSWWSSISPGKAEPVLNLGVAHEKTGRLDTAESLYREAAAAEPGFWRAPYNLGALLWKRARWGEAAEALAEASRLKPEDEAIKRFAARAREKAR